MFQWFQNPLFQISTSRMGSALDLDMVDLRLQRDSHLGEPSIKWVYVAYLGHIVITLQWPI